MPQEYSSHYCLIILNGFWEKEKYQNLSRENKSPRFVFTFNNKHKNKFKGSTTDLSVAQQIERLST